MKKVKGFTLIELIVVIAIIGVLAAILVPALMGWIAKSRIATYNSNASEVCTQLQTVLTEINTDPSSAGGFPNGQVVLVCQNGTVTGITDATLKQKISDINNNLKDMTGVEWAARIENQIVQGISFSANGRRNVGGFPVQCPGDAKYTMNTSNKIEAFVDAAAGISGKDWSKFTS